MIMRGGGATGAAGRAGAALCIGVTFDGTAGAGGGAIAMGDTGGVARGGTAMAGALATFVAAGGGAGVAGTLGGITTTDGGLYVAATDAGVTIRGAGARCASAADLGAATLEAGGAADAAGAGAFISEVGGAATGGLSAGRGADGSDPVPFCCVMARNTSPGREMLERSILVLMPSSLEELREDFAALGASERPRRCLRTRSAS